MTSQKIIDVAVVGGGIIGIASALALQATGRSVVLIDRSEPGGGCSAGNAGVIATSFVLPLASVAHILAAPRMLLSATGPLSMPLQHTGHYASWMYRFARAATPKRRLHAIALLKLLNGRALVAWRDLLGPDLAAQFLREKGMLDIIRADRPTKKLWAHAEALASEGIALDRLSPDEVADLEPSLTRRISAGVLHRDVAHVTNPLDLSRALVTRFRTGGGEVLQRDVSTVAPEGDAVAIRCADDRILAGKALIAAGWWSRQLVEPLGLACPLRAERGYHVMLPGNADLLGRPVSFHEESFLATPMWGGLRLAGTVELAPPSAKPDWRRADMLPDLAEAYLPPLDREGSLRWMGSRPSFADSLPAIGIVPAAPNILYAFGHQHLGLTQAAVTAEYIRELIAGSAPANIENFSLARFGRASARAFADQELAA